MTGMIDPPIYVSFVTAKSMANTRRDMRGGFVGSGHFIITSTPSQKPRAGSTPVEYHHPVDGA